MVSKIFSRIQEKKPTKKEARHPFAFPLMIVSGFIFFKEAAYGQEKHQQKIFSFFTFHLF
jgi:hypothetical protein